MVAPHYQNKMNQWGDLVTADQVDFIFDDQCLGVGDTLYDAWRYGDQEQEGDHGSLSGLPVASATLLEPNANPIDDSQAERPRQRLSFDAADPTVDALLSYSRPEFIFASACILNPKKKKIGIFLKNRRKGGATVVRLSADSPFLNCNIQK